MAWTYSGNPASSNRDAVRFLIGDTDTTDQQLQDAEIDWLLVENPNPNMAAAHACEALAAKYARQVSTTNLSLSVSAGDRQAQYLMLATKLRRQAQDGGATMFVGGTSIAEKLERAENADEVQPAFQIGEDDYYSPTIDPDWRRY